MVKKSRMFSIICGLMIFASTLFVIGCSKSPPVEIDKDVEIRPDIIDTDKDGIGDNEDSDDDNDGLSDEREIWWATDPKNRDTDDDTYSDGDEIDHGKGDGYPYTLDMVRDKDGDGDGIPTAAEVNETKTNPKIGSTDGDRYSDGMEYFGYDFYSKESLPAFLEQGVQAPFSPATPDIIIEIKPHVKLILSREVTLGQKIYEADEHKYAINKGYDVRVTSESGVEMAYSAKLGWPPWKSGGTAEVRAYQNFNFETSGSFAKRWLETEVTKEEIYSSNEINLSESELSVGLIIRNIGSDILTSPLKEITLNLYLGRDEDPFISVTDSNVITNLKPGGKIDRQLRVPITFEVFQRFHAGEGVDIRVEHYSFGEDQKFLINAQERCVQIDVCDTNTLKRYYVAPRKKLTFSEVCKLAGIQLELSHEGSKIIGINGQKNQTENLPYCWWTLFIPKNKRDTLGSIESVELKPGDHVLLKYNKDSDGDMLSDVEEQMMGTDKDKKDTDEDGLTDGESIKELGQQGEITFHTNPLLKDTDRDGWSDGQEVTMGTKPDDPNDYPVELPIMPHKQEPVKFSFTKSSQFSLDFKDGDGLLLGDTDGDNEFEILHGDRRNGIAIYSIQGEQLDEFEMEFNKGDCLAAGDIDGDGINEIVHGKRYSTIPLGKVEIYSMQGNRLNDFRIDLKQHDCLAVGDIQGDGIDEILHGDRWFQFQGIRAYSGSGTILKELNVRFDKGDGLSVGDLNGDGRDEIVHGIQKEGVKIYGASPEPDFFELNSTEFKNLAVADINGDGRSEIVYKHSSGSLKFLSLNGEVIGELELDFKEGDGLAFGDTNGDGSEDIVHAEKNKRLTIYISECKF